MEENRVGSDREHPPARGSVQHTEPTRCTAQPGRLQRADGPKRPNPALCYPLLKCHPRNVATSSSLGRQGLGALSRTTSAHFGRKQAAHFKSSTTAQPQPINQALRQLRLYCGPNPIPSSGLRSLKVLLEPGRDLPGSAGFCLGFASARNKVKFRNKSRAAVFALAGRQHEEPHSLPKQPTASAGDVRPSSPQKMPQGPQGGPVTFLLAVVVMARPLGSSRAVLCFLMSWTETTGMTTWRGKHRARGFSVAPRWLCLR